LSLNWANNNHNYVPAYQMSGIPFQTGSASSTSLTTTPVEVKFPYVTRWIQVRNIGSNILRLGFTQNGVQAVSGRHFLIVAPGMKTPMFEVKCTSVFVRSHSNTTGFDVMAGYTSIPTDQIFVLTGSNGFEGIG
jgi:hypothetical protein